MGTYNVDIGGKSGHTWGLLRAPLVVGTGLKGTWPVNKNWSTAGFSDNEEDKKNYFHSSGYPDSSGVILKARNTIVNGTLTGVGGMFATGSFIGCNFLGMPYEGDGMLYWLILGFGDGIYRHEYNGPNPREEIYTWEAPDFDRRLMRKQYVGWMVNVSVQVYHGGPTNDYEFPITEELFPDDTFGPVWPWMGRRGQKFAEVVIPWGSQVNWAGWTINSVSPP